MGFLISFLLAVLLPCTIVVYRWQRSPYRRMPEGARRLPGPRSMRPKHSLNYDQVLTILIDLPLIGRVHDIPAEKTWLVFWKWAQDFGPIYKHDLFGTTHVWISSEQIAKDLLARQGSIFSDRPLIDNLPINKTGGEYLPLLGENGMLVLSCHCLHVVIDLCFRDMDSATQVWAPSNDNISKRGTASLSCRRDQAPPVQSFVLT